MLHIPVSAKEYPEVEHQWDVWHGGKNLGKKLTVVSRVVSVDPLCKY